MSEYSIQIRDLGKMYRLFSRPVDKVWDALGMEFLLKGKKHQPQEFWALRGLNLDIKKGERIGIIGRNGAGKSTLLKIICGNLTQTEGEMKVNGKIQALLELGTGFHPEFSGRENIRSYLAYQGLTQQQIAAREEEIIDFAELEEFIEQPLKTYSAGMYARLAFSTATAIEPEILIIDEVLGAGDAYFAGKCVERMEKLTQETGATVLFVSHDMSSVERLCNRAIWIDRGIITHAGNTTDVSKAYAAENRRREHIRLQAKNSLMKVSTMEKLRKSISPIQLITRLVMLKDSAVKRVGLCISGYEVSNVAVGSPQDASPNSSAFVLLDSTVSSWGKPSHNSFDDSWFRPILSPKLSGAIVFNLDGIDLESELKVVLEMQGEGILQVFDGEIYQDVGIVQGDERWTKNTISIPREILCRYLASIGIIDHSNNITDPDEELLVIDEEAGVSELRDEYEIFSGDLRFVKVKFSHGGEFERFVFKTFDRMEIKITFEVLNDVYQLEFVACFHRDGIIAFQSLSGLECGQKNFYKKGEIFTATLVIPEISLGRGKYLVSLAVFPAIDHNSLDTEKTAYVLQDRRYEILIEQPEGGAIDLGIARSHCCWKVN